jgi:extradiol dioxygenase family protein
MALYVSNLETSKHFYQKLGGKTTSKPSDKFVEILFGGHRLHLVQTPSKPSYFTSTLPRIDHFAVSVPDAGALEHVCQTLNKCDEIKAWAPFKIIPSPPMGQGEHLEQRPPLKTLYAKDPDGITIEIRCYSEV